LSEALNVHFPEKIPDYKYKTKKITFQTLIDTKAKCGNSGNMSCHYSEIKQAKV